MSTSVTLNLHKLIHQNNERFRTNAQAKTCKPCAKGRQVLPEFENVLAWPRTRRMKGSSEGHRGVEVKSVGLGGERKTHTKDHRL